MKRQRIFLLASIAALAVAAWLNVQPIHSQVIGGGSSVIGGGNAAKSAADSAARFNPPVNRIGGFPVDTGGVYRNAKFIGATIPCVVPTSYATNDQALHPSVVYIPQGWNSYKYWMAMTPFPENEANPGTYELPEIVASNDGQTWEVPSGLTNPIDTPSSGYIHNDTQLFFENNILYCFYGHLKSDSSTCDTLYQTSTDGTTWSGRRYLITGNTAKDDACPVIEKVGSTYYLWTASYPTGPGTGTMYLRTSSSLTGTYSAATQCTFVGLGTNVKYWHGDIKYIGDRFVLIGMFYTPNYGQVILHGYSFDGLTFYMEYHAGTNTDYGTYAGTTGAFDATITSVAKMYRPCFVPHADGKHFDVWYSINHSTDSEIAKGEMFITPNPEYSYDKLDQMVSHLGDLRGFWPVFERSGTVVADYSVKAHNLTPTGTNGLSSWATLPTFKSPIHLLTLDGTNDYLSTADHNDFSFGDGSAPDLAFSVGAWVYMAANDSNDKIILSKYSNAAPEWRFWLDNAEKLIFGFNDLSVGATAYRWNKSDAALSVGAWHFVVGTYSGVGGTDASAGVKLYVDGVLVASSRVDGAGAYDSMENLGASVGVGYMTTTVPYGMFPGKIALPFITGTELSAANVALLYRLGQGILQTTAR